METPGQPDITGIPIPTRQTMITISRQFKAGGHNVAERLVKRLGAEWEIHDKKLVDEMAESAQVRNRMVEVLDERTQSWIQEVIRVLFKERVLEPLGYRRHLALVLLSLAHQGQKIIIGRGANFILHDALNVRLEASEACRAQSLMDRDGISRTDAVHLIHKRDQDRAAFTQTTFNRDVHDPAQYDLVIQTDKLGFDAVAVIIETAWREKVKYQVEMEAKG